MRPKFESTGPQGSTGRQKTRATMARREFLALSSSWALVPWLGGLATAAAQPLSPVRAAAPLSVGYLERSELFSSFDVAPWKVDGTEAEGTETASPRLDVYPATRLPAGDPSFGWESAEITVFGLYPPLPEGRKRRVHRAALEVTYRIEDPDVTAPVPFLAWAYGRIPVENEGCEIRFTAPVDRERGLSLVLHVESLQARRPGQQSSPAAKSLRADFTVNFERDRPKLQRGVYLLGLRPGLFDRAVSLPQPEDPSAMSYPALVLSIDHVSQQDA